MAPDPKSWSTGGRSWSWRAGMLLGGLILCGYAWALVRWPWLLGWSVAAGCALVGVFCVASALLARGK